MVRIKRGRCRVVFALFLFIFLSSLLLVSAETTGCYTNPKATEDLYCISGITDTIAQADCDKDSSCKLDQYFTPQLPCTKVDACQKITCDVDCQEHALGKCTSLGGKEVSDEDYTLKCSPGCCKVGNFCQYNLIQSQCLQQAKLKGLETYTNFDIGPPMDAQICAKTICALDLKKEKLTVTIVEIINDKEIPIPSAKITFDGLKDSTITDSQGLATIQLNPGIYLLKAIPPAGYLSTSLSLTIKSDQENTQKIILQKGQGTGKLQGTVKQKIDDKTPPAPVLGALISWEGPTNNPEPTPKTDNDGKFSIENLPLGKYTFTISKIGYISITKIIDITAAELPSQEIILELIPKQIIWGIVFEDKNTNGVQDKGEPGLQNAKLIIDGVLRGFSAKDGIYSIPITLKAKEGKEKHSILATYANKQSKQQDFFEITKGQTVTKNLALIGLQGVCVEGITKPVESFTANHVPGKKEILLQWLRPCPEIVKYELKITEKSTGQITTKNLGPTDLQYIDTNVQWQETYTYELLAVYDKKPADKAASQTITLGVKECENKFTPQSPSKFCLTGNSDTRKTIWYCDEQNKIQSYTSCKDKDILGDDYYCAQITPTLADCKKADLCRKAGNPFGLYYQKDLCYGTPEADLTAESDTKKAKNFCYFDSSSPLIDYTSSIVDQCNSCTSISNCFQYNSKQSCEINNCLSTECQWLNGADNPSIITYGDIQLPTQTTAETGSGYCLPKAYDNDDKCTLCGPKVPPSSLFENHYCTADICSSLGRCFSDPQVKECTGCGKIPTPKSNCYTYTTEKECTSDQNVEIINGIIKPSKDKCGWNRCRWNGQKDVSGANCFKDSDGDEKDDCEKFTLDTERLSCKVDMTPPKTTIKNMGKNILSFGYPNVLFTGDDSSHATASQRSPLSTLKYCLVSAESGAQNICTNFSEVSYNGNKVQPEELNVAILKNSEILKKKIPGAVYSLQFYSTDRYHNQEDLKLAFFYVDTLLPEFEIVAEPKTTKDTTLLSVSLKEPKEPVVCNITLTSLIPEGEHFIKNIPRTSTSAEVSFDNLKGVKYNISASCTDDQGNTNIKEKQLIFDLDQNIDVIYPAFNDVISKTEIAFKIHTDVAATCALYNTKTQEKIIEFNIIDEVGKEHETPVLDGFIEREYIGEHKILCAEVVDPTKTHTDYFAFTIDFTPPETQITLTESKRIEMPVTYGWEEFFINKAGVGFTCTSKGFPCDKTYYCQGPGCESIKNTNYKEYSTSFEVTNSSQICYYSTDLGKTVVYQPTCGLITVDGYGIHLEKPQLHYYNNQQWGVSNTIPFLWQFVTRVPTTQCKYDIQSDFSYADVPSFRILQPTADKNYQVPLFPNESGTAPYDPKGSTKELYVRCENSNGELSPEQKMNLEYDPSPPIILETKAIPNPVFEGIKTTLILKTDDKTICKFSDKGHTSYESMPYAFPGAEPDITKSLTTTKHILTQDHTTDFYVNTFIGLKKVFPFTFRCKNGAGDLSNSTSLNLTIDYSQLGGILSFSPNKETYAATNINLQIITSKKAKCTYNAPSTPNTSSNTSNNNSNNLKIPLAGAGTTTHTKTLTNLKEDNYKYPFSCVMGEHTIQGLFDFTIDLTTPQITSVEDGKYTCGSSDIAVIVYSNKKNITNYYYEVYDVGYKEPETSTPSLNVINSTKDYISYYTSTSATWKPPTSTSQFTNSTTSPKSTLPPDATVKGTLVLNATVPYTSPILIPITALNQTHTYITRVKAQDIIGHWSAFVASDGIMLTNKTYNACANDTKAPTIDFTSNESCSSILIELHCLDADVGCKSLKYGQATNAKECTPNKPYSGEKIEIIKSGTICYTALDYTNNSLSSLKTYSQKDSDGDGISDFCDSCSKTSKGTLPNQQGCGPNDLTESEKKKDTDGDGLPDIWEQQYNSEDCPLDYKKQDSNGDGVKDTDEDYDADESSNYIEYTSYQDPCVKDGIPPKTDEELEQEKSKKKTPSDTTTTTESSLLPWIFLFIGLFLITGGVGYLVYYYNYTPAGKSSGGIKGTSSTPTSRSNLAGTSQPTSQATKGLGGVRDKFLAFEHREQDKLKSRMRESVFSTFSRDSKTIPHIDNIIQKKTDTLPNLQQAAQKYADHKDEIKPGLKPAERSVFDKLENIAQKTQDKKIEDVVSQKQADDLFAKLRQISEKRKTTKK